MSITAAEDLIHSWDRCINPYSSLMLTFFGRQQQQVSMIDDDDRHMTDTQTACGPQTLSTALPNRD